MISVRKVERVIYILRYWLATMFKRRWYFILFKLNSSSFSSTGCLNKNIFLNLHGELMIIISSVLKVCPFQASIKLHTSMHKFNHIPLLRLSMGTLTWKNFFSIYFIEEVNITLRLVFIYSKMYLCRIRDNKFQIPCLRMRNLNL